MATENTSENQGHILIVDDDWEMAKIMSTAFESAGYATTVARDGNEGLAVAETKSPDLIVLDIMMPRRSGFLVLERLRQILESPIPVVVVTGNFGDRHRNYAEVLGVGGYFHKPVKLPVLLEKVNELLTGSELGNE
ncbi:response regulator transcription factor [Mariniblastus sp.]|nr:response regulator transcription factor [Mariniblastus sp.]